MRPLIALALTLAAAAAFAHPAGASSTQADPVRSLYKSGHFAAARRAASRLPADSVETLDVRGDLAFYVGDYSAAAGYFARARAKDSKDVHAIRGLGSVDVHLARFDAALSLARAGLKLKVSRGDRSRLLTVLGGAQGLKADRGSLFDKIKYGPRVLGTLKQAVALDSQNAAAVYAIGRFYLEAPGVVGGNPSKAVPTLERAVRLDPYDFLHDAWLIRAYEKTGQSARATSEISSYKRKFGGLPAAMAELGTIKD